MMLATQWIFELRGSSNCCLFSQEFRLLVTVELRIKGTKKIDTFLSDRKNERKYFVVAYILTEEITKNVVVDIITIMKALRCFI